MHSVCKKKSLIFFCGEIELLMIPIPLIPFPIIERLKFLLNTGAVFNRDICSLCTIHLCVRNWDTVNNMIY
jgi:hypothetical protein